MLPFMKLQEVFEAFLLYTKSAGGTAALNEYLIFSANMQIYVIFQRLSKFALNEFRL